MRETIKNIKFAWIYLKDQKKKDSLITTVLFNDEYELLHFREDVKKVKKLNNESYKVDGCTALYDAIGKTIKKLDKEITDDLTFIYVSKYNEVFDNIFKVRKKDKNNLEMLTLELN